MIPNTYVPAQPLIVNNVSTFVAAYNPYLRFAPQRMIVGLSNTDRTIMLGFARYPRIKKLR